MPTYPLKCNSCQNTIEFSMPAAQLTDPIRRRCPVCEQRRTFKRDWSAGIAAFHPRLSPKHPRAGRGRAFHTNARKKP